MSRKILLALGLALTGCAAASDVTTGSLGGGAGPYPTEYRRIAKEFVRTTFKDPYSIRDAQIAAPKIGNGPSLLGNGVMATPWIVCVRANSKNSFGAYAGLRETAIHVYQEKGVSSWDRAIGGWDPFWPCAGVQYEPFSEVTS